MKTKNKIGILLLNLGGPERLEDVRPFLFNLFSDRNIIRLGPAFLQKPLARLVANRRAPVSMANYARIGGGSPIRRKTEEQAQALEQALRPDGDFVVRPCMRYWHPLAEEALLDMEREGVQTIIALPLYPHYSIATTGSSLLDLRRTADRLGITIPVRDIMCWPDEPAYIDCLADRILAGIQSFEGKPIQVVYSAHSLPMEFIREGDPYVEHLQQTIRAIEERTAIAGKLCYQSRGGPMEWLGPSLPMVIAALAREGCANLLVVPISFVSDHVETLYEINIQHRETAEALGMGFASTPGLNADPRFIAGLRNLVLAALDDEEEAAESG